MTLDQLNAVTGATSPPATPTPAVHPAGQAAPSPAPAAPHGGISAQALQAATSDFKPLPQAPGPLQVAGDIVNLPYVLAGAAARGTAFGPNMGEVKNVVGEVAHKGLRGLQDVNDRYSLFAPEELAHDKADHPHSLEATLAQALIDHPKAAGAFDLATQLVNPANEVFPPVGRLAGRLVSPVARTIAKAPVISNVVKGVRESFDPYHGIVDAARSQGVDPKTARRFGQQFTGASADVDAKSGPALQEIFGTPANPDAKFKSGIDAVRGVNAPTREERIEIERRSENFSRAPGQRGYTVKNPERPAATLGGTLSDAELTKRARQYRLAIMSVDHALAKTEPALADRMMASREYTPRYASNYTDDSVPPELLKHFEEDISPSSPGTRGASKGTLAVGGGSKRYFSYDEAAASGHLDPDYDPAENLKSHFRSRLYLLKRMQQAQELKAMAPDGSMMRDLDFSEHFPDPSSRAMKGIGPERTGKAGYQNLIKVLNRQARPIAAQQTLDAMRAQGIDARGRTRLVTAGINRATGARSQALKNALAAAQRMQEAGGSYYATRAKAAEQLEKTLDRAEAQAQAVLKRANITHGQRVAATQKLVRVATYRQKLALEKRLGTQGSAWPVKGTNDLAAQMGANIFGRSKGKLARDVPTPRAPKAPEPEPAPALAKPVPTRGGVTRDQVTQEGSNRYGQQMRQGVDDLSAKTQDAAKAAPGAMTDAIDAVRAKVGSAADRISRPALQAANAAFRGETRAIKQFANLDTKAADLKYDNAVAQQYKSAMEAARKDIAKKLIDNALAKVYKGEQQAGRVVHWGPDAGRYTENNLREFGPKGEFVSVPPQLDTFLREQNVSGEQAHGVAKAIAQTNKLSRVFFVSNPTVHVLWNLNLQFLGAHGNIGDLAHLWTGWHPSEEEIAFAEDHGALTHFSPQFEGLVGTSYGKMLGSYKDLKPLEKVDKAATALWNANQQLVFEHMETKFAVKLHQQFMREGLSPDAAGLKVRETLGNYANVSRQGIEKGLNQALFFYPWVKTIAPFWVKAITDNPRAWAAPMHAIRANNLGNQDPNTATETPYTIDLNKSATDPRYYSAPVVARIANDVLSVFFPKGDPTGDITDRVKAGDRLVQNHFNPTAGTIVDMAQTLYSPATDPNENYHIQWDKAAPPDVEAGQMAQTIGEHVVPLPLPIKQGFEFARELPTKPPSEIAGDIGEGFASTVVGGSSYDSPVASRKFESASHEQMVRAVNAYRRAGRPDLARQAYFNWVQVTKQFAGTQ